MKINWLLPIFLFSCTIGFSQLTINTTNFSVSTQSGTSTISVSRDVHFNSSGTNGNATLVLSGINQAITSNSQRTIPNLTIAGGGIKNFSGDYLISSLLSLEKGIIIPSGNLIISSTATINETNVGNDTHISGTLYREYSGSVLSYPIGISGIYTPVRIETATGTKPLIGITASNSVPIVDQLPSGVTDKSVSWSWILNTIGGDFSTAQVTLPFMDEDRSKFGDDGYRPVVLYNESGQSTTSLFNNDAGASSIDISVTAQDAGRVGTYFIGKEKLFTPIINNIITPDGNSINDYLTILNLSLYPENNVKLIDRYGVEVFYKDNYISPLADANDGDEDFSFLAAGNYVCILNYKDIQTGEWVPSVRQGITVLK